MSTSVSVKLHDTNYQRLTQLAKDQGCTVPECCERLLSDALASQGGPAMTTGPVAAAAKRGAKAIGPQAGMSEEEAKKLEEDAKKRPGTSPQTKRETVPGELGAKDENEPEDEE
jgi:hypothetical protein